MCITSLQDSAPRLRLASVCAAILQCTAPRPHPPLPLPHPTYLTPWAHPSLPCAIPFANRRALARVARIRRACQPTAACTDFVSGDLQTRASHPPFFLFGAALLPSYFKIKCGCGVSCLFLPAATFTAARESLVQLSVNPRHVSLMMSHASQRTVVLHGRAGGVFLSVKSGV